jgi:hypothetical protein
MQKERPMILSEMANVINNFTIEFAKDFCDEGKINWEKLVKFNSSIVPPKRIAQKTTKIKGR